MNTLYDYWLVGGNELALVCWMWKPSLFDPVLLGIFVTEPGLG